MLNFKHICAKPKDCDLHPHVKVRMIQRGITKEEIEKTLANGKEADDAKTGTFGKMLVFSYNNNWEGKFGFIF